LDLKSMKRLEDLKEIHAELSKNFLNFCELELKKFIAILFQDFHQYYTDNGFGIATTDISITATYKNLEATLKKQIPNTAYYYMGTMYVLYLVFSNGKTIKLDLFINPVTSKSLAAVDNARDVCENTESMENKIECLKLAIEEIENLDFSIIVKKHIGAGKTEISKKKYIGIVDILDDYIGA